MRRPCGRTGGGCSRHRDGYSHSYRRPHAALRPCVALPVLLLLLLVLLATPAGARPAHSAALRQHGARSWTGEAAVTQARSRVIASTKRANASQTRSDWGSAALTAAESSRPLPAPNAICDTNDDGPACLERTCRDLGARGMDWGRLSLRVLGLLRGTDAPRRGDLGGMLLSAANRRAAFRAVPARLLPPSRASLARGIRFGTCAVVGNSGTLLLTEYGREIDAHSAVFRLNAGRTAGFAKHVGSRTHFRLLNGLWTGKYPPLVGLLSTTSPGQAANRCVCSRPPPASLVSATARNNKASVLGLRHGQWVPLQNLSICILYRCMHAPRRVPLERKVTLIASRGNKLEANYVKLAQFMRAKRTDVSTTLLHPDALTRTRRALDSYRRCALAGGKRFSGGGAPSSGLVLVYNLKDICGRVSVYGFGSDRVQGRAPAYQYYTRREGNPTHSFSAEMEFIRSLAHSNYIRLCTAGSCIGAGTNNDSSLGGPRMEAL